VFNTFEASFYNFATFLGATTRRYYRLDLDACHYLGVTPARALDPFRAAEPDGLLEVPSELLCLRCESRFSGPELASLPPSESTVAAIIVQPGAQQ
jgi:hypothetical protein